MIFFNKVIAYKMTAYKSDLQIISDMIKCTGNFTNYRTVIHMSCLFGGKHDISYSNIKKG